MKLLPKTVNSIFWIGTLAAFALSLAGGAFKNALLILIGIILLFVALIFRVTCYKCPFCRKYLYKSKGKTCPCCGRQIEM